MTAPANPERLFIYAWASGDRLDMGGARFFAKETMLDAKYFTRVTRSSGAFPQEPAEYVRADVAAAEREVAARAMRTTLEDHVAAEATRLLDAGLYEQSNAMASLLKRLRTVTT